MSSGYRISEQDEAHYVTFQIVKWIDIFTRQVYRDVIIDSLRYSQQNKALEVYAYVIIIREIKRIVANQSFAFSSTKAEPLLNVTHNKLQRTGVVLRHDENSNNKLI